MRSDLEQVGKERAHVLNDLGLPLALMICIGTLMLNLTPDY